MSIVVKQLFLSSLFLSLLFLNSSIASAQSMRACELQAADADGDGFGQEFDFENGRWDSCVITSESAPPPSYTNRETGEPVTLVRAFWDPNTDIANRDIRCENYWFDDDSGVYEETPERTFAINSPILGSYNLLHQPLPSERPYLNTATGYYDFSNGQPRRYVPLWGVENGIYQGVAPMAQSPYVEIVNINGGDSNAVRVWSEDSIYNVCYDTSGDAFVPTGSPGVVTTNPVAAPEERVVKLPMLEDLDPPPVNPPPYTNLETGQQVVLTEPYWNYNADLALRRILCNTYDWNEAENRYEHDPFNDFLKYDFVFHPLVGNSARVTSTYTDVTVSIFDDVLTIDDDGVLPFREGLGQVEIVDQAVRIWTSNTRYRQCTSVKLLGAADVNTHIWEFPNAYQLNFFESNGYPEDNRVSFAPTGTAPEIDTETGTNPEESDQPTVCIDTPPVGDGWGWDGVQSCVLDKSPDFSPGACIDNDGDGWGWNGVNSCLVDSCVDTDGDGWGWDGSKSCRTGNLRPVQGACVDTDGDGWGWDGMNSCRIPTP